MLRHPQDVPFALCTFASFSTTDWKPFIEAPVVSTLPCCHLPRASSWPFLLSGNSEPGVYGGQRQTAHNRHRFERICKFGPAVTAHLVGLSFERENSADVAVVTTKQEFEDDYKPRERRIEH